MWIPNNSPNDELIQDAASILGTYEMMRDQVEVLVNELPPFILLTNLDSKKKVDMASFLMGSFKLVLFKQIT